MALMQKKLESAKGSQPRKLKEIDVLQSSTSQSVRDAPIGKSNYEFKISPLDDVSFYAS